MGQRRFAPLLVIGIIAALAIASAIGYFAWKRAIAPTVQIQQSPLSQATPSTENSATTQSVQNNAPPPQIQFSTPDYKLFSATDYSQYTITYIIAGVLNSGKYKGYHLVVAYEDSGGLDTGTYFFATKDFKTFVVDTSNDPSADGYTAKIYAEGGKFNATTVIGADSISFYNPPSVINEGNFALINNGFNWESFLNLATASSTSIASNVPNLWFFVSKDTSDPSIEVETAEGLVFDYTLISKEGVVYKEEQDASSTLLSTERNPIFYKSADFATPAITYGGYGILIPSDCGEGTAQVLDVQIQDLVPIVQTKSGVQLYTFKNPNDSINEDEYKQKITFAVSLGSPRSTTASTTFEQYVKQNPVLIFEDPWGRWIGIGEIDYPIVTGGCGKPVIYLYPPKPTEVTVKFTTPMQLTTDIPTYANGWDVLANPDGELIDLQPNLTNCDSIDSTVSGSEYAQIACKQNDYPYLYWAGQASRQYPTPTGGWIVPQGNISDFLNQKLTKIGLTDKEKSDMMDYWVPELLAKNAPYYRISFFQTEQLNQFIPMQVTPNPDTVIRVFLDWSPLSSMPAVQPQPQVLNHINRTGFTLVEWGGLKQ